MSKQHWLVKQEPTDYSWDTFAKEGRASWTGVRNFQARNHLRSMRKGDLVLFYHSGEQKMIVGLAKVAKEAFPDPTASEGDWSAVELLPIKALPNPISLERIKAEPALQQVGLVRQSRLSVMPLTSSEFLLLEKMASR